MYIKKKREKMGVQNKHYYYCALSVALHCVCSYWPDLLKGVSALQKKTRLWDWCCCARLDLYHREEEAAFVCVCVCVSLCRVSTRILLGFFFARERSRRRRKKTRKSFAI